MCGVFGFISAAKLPIDLLFKGTDIIRHRGPDGEGAIAFEGINIDPLILAGPDTPQPQNSESIPPWFPQRAGVPPQFNAKIGLSHRRLSIVDLSPMGHQPMSYQDGRYWISYNGEIYNHIELRAELTALGHQFLSHSDTEVILAAYAEWGTDCLQRLNGMWAFALYDTRDKMLFLARDRFGVKPLYYWMSPTGNLFFGSEIKQFTVMPDWSASVNLQRAFDFLEYGLLDHTDETLFKGVYHVQSGHYALLPVSNNVNSLNGRIGTHQWYDVPCGKFKGDFPEAAQEFQKKFKDAVKLRLRSDVAIGSCLSGGLDSSSIVCVIQNLMNETANTNSQKTFSALAKVEKFNENKWIEKVVEHKKIDVHYTTPELGDLLQDSESIIWHQDEPYGSTSIFAQWAVFKLAADHNVKVMLDGQGADEQLFGYHYSFRFYLTSLLRQGKIISFVRELMAMKRKFSLCIVRTTLFAVFGLLPKFIKKYFYGRFGTALLYKKLVNSSFFKSVETGNGIQENVSAPDYCHSLMMSKNLPMLLHWEDRDSMAHSLESRVPFLDYRLVEFIMSLPDDYKMKDGVTKRVLRTSMSGIIPDEIRDRADKIGFATPEEVWVREQAPEEFRKKMRRAIDHSGGILTDKCMDYLEDVIHGRERFDFALWRLISFGEWMKVFSVKVNV